MSVSVFSFSDDNPILQLLPQSSHLPSIATKSTDILDCENTPWTPLEIYNLIKDIQDPELPQTLGELDVVSEDRISIESDNTVVVSFIPTVPHCSMGTFIGLAIRVKLLHCLPHKFKISVRISGHDTEEAINKQLADKERVAAAIEQEALRDSIYSLIN
ncbi:hypothetical protein P9112_011288 [Eukaryota sp. TZLM1-RC]